MPDITSKFDNPTGVALISNIGPLGNGSIDLSKLSIPSGQPCGPGFIVAVVYSKSNGSYVEFLSQSVDIKCNASIDIRQEMGEYLVGTDIGKSPTFQA